MYQNNNLFINWYIKEHLEHYFPFELYKYNVIKYATSGWSDKKADLRKVELSDW